MTKAERNVLLKIINSIQASDDAEEQKDVEQPQYITNSKDYRKSLEKRLSSFNSTEPFEPGTIVIWKEGLKNKRIPGKDQPAIVVKLIKPAKVHSEDLYEEELDVVLGFITEDDEFLTFSYDSRRFQTYRPI